jgi:hypothetical protein
MTLVIAGKISIGVQSMPISARNCPVLVHPLLKVRGRLNLADVAQAVGQLDDVLSRCLGSFAIIYQPQTLRASAAHLRLRVFHAKVRIGHSAGKLGQSDPRPLNGANGIGQILVLDRRNSSLVVRVLRKYGGVNTIQFGVDPVVDVSFLN